MFVNILNGDTGVKYCWIEGYAGYAVGTDGSVWSCRMSGPIQRNGATFHKLKPHVIVIKPGKRRKRPYYRAAITLTNNGKRRHIRISHLVLNAFVSPCPPGMEACHEDGDSLNNRLENLRWGTRSSNYYDAVRHGTKGVGEKCGHAKLSDLAAKEIKVIGRLALISQNRMAKAYKVSRSCILGLLRADSWSHLGPSDHKACRKQKKLNVFKARKIKARLAAGEAIKTIAPDFGVHERTIYSIRLGKLWADTE